MDSREPTRESMSKRRIEQLELRVAKLEEELLKNKPRFGVFCIEKGELVRIFDSFDEAQEEACGLDRYSLNLVDGKYSMGGKQRYIVKPI